MARICQLAFSYYENDSRTRRETEALASRGDEVDVVCLKEPNGQPVQTNNGVRLMPISVAKYRGDSNVTYLLRYFSFFVRAFFKITSLHWKRRYDIIQVHTMPDFLVFAALIPRISGAKIILDVHELMPELYISKFGLSERHPLIRFITWMERCSIRFSDKAIAVHLPHKRILIEHGNPPEKLSVLLNVPDPLIFASPKNSNPSADGKFRLVYHGTIAKRHGLEVALRALKLAKKRVPDLELDVMGDGDDLLRLKEVANELQVGDCVRFTGKMLALPEVPERVKQADVGIVPILYDEFTRYMLPVKLMEYISLRIPVIAARTETMETYFDESMVRYFEAGDEVALASHIVELYENPQQRKTLVTNAEKFNSEFSWQSQKEDYFRLIDSLL